MSEVGTIDRSTQSLRVPDIEFKESIKDCLCHTESLCKTLLPDKFGLTFSQDHPEFFYHLDNPDSRRVDVASYRSFGKSSITELAYPLRQILLKTAVGRGYNYIVLVCKSEDLAIIRTEELKDELIANSDITGLFGIQKSGRWAKKFWVSDAGTVVLPRGATQQIRGLLYGGYRPDLIILDDIETTEGVQSKDQRDKVYKWFFSDVVYSVDKNRPNKIVVIGNILHEASLLSRLQTNPAWISLNYRLFDENLHSRWPALMDDAEIKSQMDMARAQGTLDLFYSNYANIVRSPESAIFTPPFGTYHEAEIRDLHIETVILVDPARGATPTSSYSAIVVVGIDMANGKIYVRDLVNARLHQDELINTIMDLVEFYAPKVLAVEDTGVKEHITYPIKNEMVIRGMAGMVDFLELHDMKGKDDRIAAFATFYRMGRIKHNADCKAIATLEGQLIEFPGGEYKDAADALSYLPQVLEKGSIYFKSMLTPQQRREKAKKLAALRGRTTHLLPENWRRI